MTDMPCNDQPEMVSSADVLSAAGRSRRDDILNLAAGQMVVHHRRLRRRRRVTAGGVLTLAIAGLVFTAGRYIGAMAPPSKPSAILADGYGTAAPALPGDDRGGGVDIQVVRTTTAISSQFAVHTTTTAKRVSDDELVQLLDAVHRPAGLIRVDGRVMLTANVTDAEDKNDDTRQEPGPSL